MSYQEIKDKIGILEAKMQELWELILASDDDPIQRAEYINELADYSLRKKKLENSLTN